MHPINKKFFGNTANTTIKVHYNVGNGVVNGYILKQTDVKDYNVTTNGVVAGNSRLIAVTNTSLVPNGFMTILAFPVVNGVKSANAVHVTSMTSNKITTAEGPTYQWALTMPVVASPGTDILNHAVVETN